MMNVRVRFGGQSYVLTMPAGSRVEERAGAEPIIVIPGPHPDDTSTHLSPGALLRAARVGLYGLALREPLSTVGA
jgi:hypothetical protein